MGLAPLLHRAVLFTALLLAAGIQAQVATAPLETIRLTGEEIVDPTGEPLGTVQAVLVDGDGRTRYAVIRVADRFITHGLLTLVPWPLLRPGDEALYLAIDATSAAGAPTVGAEVLTRLDLNRWADAVNAYYGLPPVAPARLALPLFAALDNDADQRLSRDEVQAVTTYHLRTPPDLDARFARADADGDEVVDHSEFAAFQIAR